MLYSIVLYQNNCIILLKKALYSSRQLLRYSRLSDHLLNKKNIARHVIFATRYNTVI